MGTQHKALTWTGWAITGLMGLALMFSAIMKFRNPPEIAEQLVDKFGYPADLTLTIGVVEVACAVLYLIPQTWVLGVILLTGYLGGATATHVRVNDNFVSPIIVGVLVWLGIYLRDPRLRALLPWRSVAAPSTVGEPR